MKEQKLFGFDVEEELNRRQKRIDLYVDTFKHYHVAKEHTDNCGKCNLPLFDDIHIRSKA